MASGDRRDTSRENDEKQKVEKISQKEQSERFKEAARALGIGESSDAFDVAIKRVLKSGSRPTE